MCMCMSRVCVFHGLQIPVFLPVSCENLCRPIFSSECLSQRCLVLCCWSLHVCIANLTLITWYWLYDINLVNEVLRWIKVLLTGNNFCCIDLYMFFKLPCFGPLSGLFLFQMKAPKSPHLLSLASVLLWSYPLPTSYFFAFYVYSKLNSYSNSKPLRNYKSSEQTLEWKMN